MGHSIYLPYDFYEMYFGTPVNSVVLFALFGLLVGALFALACRLPRRSFAETGEGPSRGIARKIALVGACAAGSLFATAFLQIGIRLLNTSNDVQLPVEMAVRMFSPISSVSQVIWGLIVVAIAVVATDLAAPRLSWTARKRSVRVTFQIWLGLITIVFFFVASGISFAAITIIDLGNTDVALSDHVNKLSSELIKRDNLMTAVDDSVELAPKAHRNFEKLIYDSIDCDLSGWLEDTVVIANNDDIFSSNVEELKGASFSEVIGQGLVRESLDDVLASDKTHLYYQGSGTQISYLRGNTVDYEYLDENGVRSTGTYQIAAIVTARETFLHRWLFMALVGFVFLILLGSMSLLALRLVEVAVVKPIDETNGVLGLSRLTNVTRFPGCQRGRLRQARP